MKIFIGVFLLIQILPVYAFENLQKGTAVSDKNLSQLAYDNMDYAVADLVLTEEDSGVVIGFYREDEENDLFAISSGLLLYHTDFSKRKVISVWPLTRTPDDQTPPIIEFFEGNTRESVEQEYAFQTGNYNDPALGCLWDTPLRYGDIEQDATNELVLLLGYDRSDKINRQLDIVIFSPQQQKVIFSSRLAREDIGPLTTEAFPNYTRQDKPGQLPKISSSDTIGIGSAAIRVYSKLYLGDFDDNDKPDILVWRKRYYSKTIEDPVPGYAIRKELLSHYELNNGEYIEQTTEQTDIKTWLDGKQLTWQKGYPSQSECPGQENQLIPEMHDPLLNDPDVLK